MKKALSYGILTALLLTLHLCLASASGKDSTAVKSGKFARRTVVYKGEKMAGAGAIYANLDNKNTEILLLARDLDLSAKLFRVSPQFSVAYRDNASVGFRFAYGTASGHLGNLKVSLLSDDLSLEVSPNTDVSLRTYDAAFFHRNYIGLDRKGTVGLFCEFRLQYSHNQINFGAESANVADQFKLVFAPGAILYILPFVSVEASVGLADLTYTFAKFHQNGQQQGARHQFAAGVHPTLLNCNFGIVYHF